MEADVEHTMQLFAAPGSRVGAVVPGRVLFLRLHAFRSARIAAARCGGKQCDRSPSPLFRFRTATAAIRMKETAVLCCVSCSFPYSCCGGRLRPGDPKPVYVTHLPVSAILIPVPAGAGSETIENLPLPLELSDVLMSGMNGKALRQPVRMERRNSGPTPLAPRAHLAACASSREIATHGHHDETVCILPARCVRNCTARASLTSLASLKSLSLVCCRPSLTCRPRLRSSPPFRSTASRRTRQRA